MDRRVIRLTRQSKGLTQLEFARKLGVSRALIAQVEAGYMNPSDALIKRIRSEFSDEYIKKVSSLIS
jgi:transcriptional regulator with XRE-family HTH domain